MSPGAAARPSRDDHAPELPAILAGLRARGSVDIPVRQIPEDAAGWRDALCRAAVDAGMAICFLVGEVVTVVDMEH